MKCVIIGAGPAGLTAGYRLLKENPSAEVVILEESNDVGGISKTVNHHNNRIDIGGHRFFTKDKEVMAMWNELMPIQGAPAYDDKILNRPVKLNKGGPDPEREDRVMLTRRRVSRIFYNKKFFDYPVKMNINTIANMGLITTVAAGLSYLAAQLSKLKETSLENFYINRFGKKLYSMFFEGYTEKLWGRHPRDISADWGAQRVKGLSVSAVLKDILLKLLPAKKNRHIETSLIEEFFYPKFGPGQLWQIAASEITKMGGKIIMGCEVEQIELCSDRITKVIAAENGRPKEFYADVFISSMPLKNLVKGIKNAPETAAKIAAGLPYRDFVTVGLLLKGLSIKNKTKLKTLNNIVPDCWVYVQDNCVKLGRIQIFNNWSPYMAARPEETVWVGLEYFCNENDEYWRMTNKEWAHKGLSELKKIGVISSGQEAEDFCVERVKKAYPAYFDTYKDIDILIKYLNSIKNLYCIGRNGQHRYNNMDHSMATAFEAVRHILSGGSGDKSAIWQVNTEKEYHEEKRL